MKTNLCKRLLSLMLAVLTVFGLFSLPASAASTLEEAMKEVNVYAKKADLNWLTMNGSIQTQHYTYYNYTSVQTGETTQIPAYCVDPRLRGVPVLVPEGTAMKYSAKSTVSDPKVCGILGNGYPHEPLTTLKVNTVEEAYYATKTALWTYLLGNWSINKLGINPNLTGEDKAAAQRVLAAAKWIYNRGMGWTQLVSPKLTATPDSQTAYAAVGQRDRAVPHPGHPAPLPRHGPRGGHHEAGRGKAAAGGYHLRRESVPGPEHCLQLPGRIGWGPVRTFYGTDPSNKGDA